MTQIAGLGESNSEKAYYVSILENNYERAPFRIRTEKSTDGALKRMYTTKSGEEKEVYELRFADINSCFIAGVEKRKVTFKNGNSIEILEVKFQPENPIEPPLKLQLNVQGGLASDFLKKLPGVNFNKLVTLEFWNFVPEGKTKAKKGFTVKQDGEKIVNQFYNPDTQENLHGYPEVNEAQSEATGYWKFYYSQVFDFLYDYYLNVVKAKVDGVTKASAPIQTEVPDYEEMASEDNNEEIPSHPSNIQEEIDEDDLPF